MSNTEVLRTSEERALEDSEQATDGSEFITQVTGNTEYTGGKKKKWGAISAVGFLTAMIVVLMLFFSSGNFIISAISERLIEETDVQYADAVESKMLVFQQALSTGTIPNNTIERLKSEGVLVGNVVGGDFMESASGTTLKLVDADEIVTAGDFIVAVHNNVKLYDAFNTATYGRAAYYYDEAATNVIKKIGTSRNNYTAESDFDEVMDELLGEGSSINVNGVALFQREDDEGNIYYEYDLTGDGTSTASDTAGAWVSKVISKNTGDDSVEAALQTAETINMADTLSKEQRSALFYLAFMENISKTKAGDGNEAKINEAMNYLYESRETTAVDVKTGETVTVKGTMLESPSLYAVLSGDKFDAVTVENYASDRAIKVVENSVGGSVNSEVREGTVASTAKKTRGTIGRFLTGNIAAEYGNVAGTVPMVSESLMENSFETIGGIYGGEFLVEGAVNVGKELAKASGASAGDAAAAASYAKLNSTVLALDASVDRMNRSPFDVSSRNTFLGSIIYQFTVESNKASSILSSLATVGRVMSASVMNLLPATYADASEGFLTNYGNCETLGAVGAVGSASCAVVATFDTSTLADTFNNAEFVRFVEENTELGSDGVRKVKSGSTLANYIIYNDERITPVGFTDGGILRSVVSGSSSVSFLSDILTMIKIWLGASAEDKAVATGAVFVNSTSNAKWTDEYRWAQRYVSLARATDALRQYDEGANAYTNVPGFEGGVNPVIAFIDEYYTIADL